MAIYRGIGSASSTSDNAVVDDVTTQATNAASSASAAATSAGQAATSATNAANSATTASGHATTALGHANDASGYASDAQTALSDTQAVLANAETVYDNFDDRYLGDKASDPTLDNDGNALLTGALYFNTTDGVMKVYDGSVWLAAYASLSGALIATNNLSDLNDVPTARTNLGLGTAATTASTDYATAAQGALADSALQSSDIGVSVQAYDATILTDSDIGSTVQAYDATIVVDADIGVTVQGYDADTLKADTADTITAPMRGTVTPDNDLSFDMNITNNFKCTPAGTGTLTFTNITEGQSGNIWLDNSGGHVISAAATTYISAADLTTISTAGVYFMSYFSDGTNVAVSVTQAITGAGA